MRIRALFLFCFMSLPAIAWGVNIEGIQNSISEGYGGAVVPPDTFSRGDGKTKTPIIPDLLDDGDADGGATISDPLEGWNRLMFRFNDRMYTWVLKPTTDFYAAVLPADIRGCIDNFFINISAPVRVINSCLQGRFKDAGTELSRFAINSTIGVAGLADVAETDFGISRRRADFGQTLGRYGVGPGIFICWPVLGPSTARDSVGTVVDTLANPTTYVSKTPSETIGVNATQMVNKLSVSPDIYAELKRMSFDPYVAMRQGFADHRQAVINSAAGKTSANEKP